MKYPKARHRSLSQALAARRDGGFTLIELLLVLVILAVLAVVVVPKLTGRGKDAKLVATKTDISNIGQALDLFEVDCDRYPTTEETLRALIDPPGNVLEWKGPYLKQQTVPVDPWRNPYMYRFPGQQNPRGYDLHSFGPDGQDGTDDDIDNWSPAR
jgi:general secretion pathway protein G